jgi:D-arabinose 1-dehydrogenase-like Zn-dependent alcohol dehydrogenase
MQIARSKVLERLRADSPQEDNNLGTDPLVESPLEDIQKDISSLARGGTLVTTGGTTGFEVPLNLLPVIADQLTITGSIMGTLDDMKSMMNLMGQAGIKPEIGAVLPMERAEEAFRAMWEGKTHGKTVFTR